MENVREIRSRIGHGQWQLQKKSGVFQSRISLIERGLVQPTLKEKSALAAAFGLSIEDIDWGIF